MDLYNAQRTNFQPGAPRLAGKPGMQRQTTKRSANRGQAAVPAPAGALPPKSASKPRPMPVPPGGGAAIPAGAKKPMPQRPGGVIAKPGGVKRPMPMRPGGVVAKPTGDMSMMKKMAAFKPGM